MIKDEKQEYRTPKIEIVLLEFRDILTQSGGVEWGGSNLDGSGWT